MYNDLSPPFNCTKFKIKNCHMKKIYILIIIFCISKGKVHSQITRGNFLVGGNAMYYYNRNSFDNLRSSTFQLTPNAGYFFWDKIAAGLKINTVFQKQSNPLGTGPGDINTNSLMIGPFIRYYFFPNEKPLNLLVEANYLYGTYKTSGYYNINDGRKNNYSFLFGPVFYFNSSVGMELTLGYFNNNDISTNTSNYTIALGLGLQIHLIK